MARWKVEITGLRQVINALDEVDKRALKVITKQITDAGKDVAAAATYQVPGSNPVSNWGKWIADQTGRDLSFDPNAAAAGFQLKRNDFRRRGVKAGIGWDVFQKNAGGAIFEVMGSGKRVTTASGAALVAAINSRFPRRLKPRSLVPAYYSVMTKEFRDGIRDQIYAEARRVGLD